MGESGTTPLAPSDPQLPVHTHPDGMELATAFVAKASAPKIRAPVIPRSNKTLVAFISGFLAFPGFFAFPLDLHSPEPNRNSQHKVRQVAHASVEKGLAAVGRRLRLQKISILVGCQCSSSYCLPFHIFIFAFLPFESSTCANNAARRSGLCHKARKNRRFSAVKMPSGAGDFFSVRSAWEQRCSC